MERWPFGTKDLDGRKECFYKKNATITSTEPPLDASEVTYNLNSVGWETLYDAFKEDGIKSNFTQNMTRIRNETEHYGDFNDMRDIMIELKDNNIQDKIIIEQISILRKLENDGKVKL
jgi:hypothetical protein